MILAEISTTTVIIISVAAFLGVMLLLVSILLYAKKKLTPQGKVTLTINGERKIETDPDGTLLTKMTEEKIFLPSACGGGGTCGMCKVQVHEGAGDILPTETGFFTRKEAANDWRLGCQVKVRDNMEIEVPAEIFGIKKWECEVVSNDSVATFIKEFVVRLPEGENMDFRSGGYIQIDVPKITINYKDMIIGDEY
ncbi:MAG: 2Fe-2S iron-sulfur cluster binding domain-containing protein, partial [Bacteroidales bacterium]|nr:2Fe-2S iron-sulfur cluster binding domain-containing protein [Bacteroidales bacterium]